MDSSDVIALVSAVVSVASLVCSIYSYASSKAAAKAAQDANKLSLHGYQRELFRAFQELRTYIATDQAVNELGVRSRFAEAQFSAALYLSPALAAEFRRIYALCLAITPIVSRQEFIYNGMNAASQAGDMEQAQLLGSSYMSADSERLRATSEAEATFARVADMLVDELSLKEEEE